LDTDNDGLNNNVDPDDDGDGILDTVEQPGRALDTDNDSTPNNTDTDDDGDNILDTNEQGTLGPDGKYTLPDSDGDGLPDLVDALDTDGDGTPDVTDTDDDNDGIIDSQDKLPLDTDNDGIPNALDPEIDGDGIWDVIDPKPYDSDNDGLPNNVDTDDDNDGKSDALEQGTLGPDGKYTLPDSDGDGIPDLIDREEVSAACVTMQLKVLLEGPFDASTGKMTTTLNQRGLLPGQTPIGDFAVATPKGQPYNGVPWNYTGAEGNASGFTYPSTVVDWVLVSLRTDSTSVSNVWRGAGLLHDDGTITFVDPCYSITTTASALFVVVEHRNHLGVMTPTKVPIVAGKITFDFTQQESYVTTDPPSFGQIKDATTNKWLMYGADGNKDDFFENFDINFNDSNKWKLESGIFDQYKKGDFNMDADVNFSDSVLWKKNNGRYSRTPH
jgi:hypothetical protein